MYKIINPLIFENLIRLTYIDLQHNSNSLKITLETFSKQRIVMEGDILETTND